MSQFSCFAAWVLSQCWRWNQMPMLLSRSTKSASGTHHTSTCSVYSCLSMFDEARKENMQLMLHSPRQGVFRGVRLVVRSFRLMWALIHCRQQRPVLTLANPWKHFSFHCPKCMIPHYSGISLWRTQQCVSDALSSKGSVDARLFA